MRFSNIALALALTACVAVADNEFIIDDEAEGRELQKKVKCWQTARTPQDRCYFKSSTYQTSSRQNKMEQIWSKLVPDPNTVQTMADFQWKEFPTFFTQKSVTSFNQASDELLNPTSRVKVTHTQGLVAKVRWEPVRNNGYSGIYETGSDTVVMRISEVLNLYEGSVGHSPSVSLKFLLDGKQSENIMAQYDLSAGESWNFFHEDMSNRLFTNADLEFLDQEVHYIMGETIMKKMTEGSPAPFALGISNIADKNNDGKKLGKKKTKTPYQLIFRAPSSTRNKFSDNKPRKTWYDEIKDKLSEDEVIYEVFAWSLNEDDPRGDLIERKIADVRLMTNLFTSVWGDENLFFRHKHVHLDHKFWSSGLKNLSEDIVFDQKDSDNTWGNTVPNTWPTNDRDAKKKYMEQMEKYDCPFAWLLNRD